MSQRMALHIGAAAAAIIITVAAALPSWAQNQLWAQNPPPASPATPAEPPNITTQPSDAFGEDTTLTAKPVVFVKGAGTWDNAFAIIANSFKKLKTYVDKEGLKPDGLPMTIFTATDESGFQYQAEIPIAAAPKSPPRGEIALGQSPDGHALKFVHRGSYEGLDNTYEAITNYLDEKRLESKDLFIEEYVTDPVPANESKLVVNVYVLIK